MRPLVASGEKTKAFPPLLKLCLLNSNIIRILIIFKYKIRIEFFSHFDSPSQDPSGVMHAGCCAVFQVGV